MARVGLTPEVVVRAAVDLADEHEADDVTLAMVAERLGVRPPSLYNHVDGLDDLRGRMAVVAVERLAEACREAAMGRSGEDALVAIARSYRETARRHPGTYPLTQVARDDADWQRAAERALSPILASLAGMGLEGETAIHAVRSMRSALHGFVSLETGGGFGRDEPVDASFEYLVAMIVSGLTAPSPRAR